MYMSYYDSFVFAMLRVAHARNDVNCRWKLD